MSRLIKTTLWLTFLALLSGCGGALQVDDDGTGGTPTLITITTDEDSTVQENTTVALSARARGQTVTLNYVWEANPAISINHPSATSPDATFIAPVTTEVLTYRFTVTVTDGNNNVASDSVVVTVEPVNEAPEAIITVNQIQGFIENEYPAGAHIVLSGELSGDVDPPAGEAEIAQWRWEQTAGPSVVDGLSLDSDRLVFDAPIQDPSSQLTFTLTVTDQEGAQASDTISLTIWAAQDTLPTVQAGLDQVVYSGEVILLSGEAASINPAAYPFTYLWLNDSDLKPSIQQPAQSSTYALAPEVSETDVATFTLRATDTYGNQVENEVDVVIHPAPLARLNDTGVTQWATNSGLANTVQPNFPGQDADRGRDTAADSGLLEKAGRGEQGFDFTRLDANGDEVDDINAEWLCVRDNLTGLIWEVKDQNNGVQDNRHVYTWYATENNGGETGDEDGTAGVCGISSCTTAAYIDEINARGLCGFYDWRLPNHDEMLSIVHFGKQSGPLVDATYFPFTTQGLTAPVWYWTSDPSADGVSNTAQNAWAIDFTSGNDNFLNKFGAVYVRLVRAGR